MAEGRGFAAGLVSQMNTLAKQEQEKQDAAAAQKLAQQEASRKALADAVQNVGLVREQAFEMASGINSQLVELAKVGQLTPEIAAQHRAARDSIIAEYALVMQDVRTLVASDPNTDPTLAASMGSTEKLLQFKRQQYDSEILGAFADSPEVQGRAEAIQKISAYETAIGRNASPDEIKRLFGTDRDPRVVNFIGPGGERKSIDMTAPGAAGEVKKLTAQGYWAVGGQLQGQSIDAFIDKGDRTDWEAFQKNTIMLYAETARLRQQAFSMNEPVYTGLVGDVLSGLNTTVNQYKQFSDFMQGGESLESDLLDENGNISMSAMNFDSVFERMEESGVDDRLLAAARNSRAFKFNLFGLAFMLARLRDPNDRLSAQEVQFQIDNLGSGNLSTLGAILDEVDRMAAASLDAEVQVRELNPNFDKNQIVPSLRTKLNNYRSGATGGSNLGTDNDKMNVSDDDMAQVLIDQVPANGKLSAEWQRQYKEQPEAVQRKVWAELQKRLNSRKK